LKSSGDKASPFFRQFWIGKLADRYKYYVSGHYPLSYLYLKIPPCLYYKTHRFIDWILSPSSGKTYIIGPEIGTSFIDWAQLSRFHLKTETESSFQKVLLKCKQDGVFR
jgi:hypothetical protein